MMDQERVLAAVCTGDVQARLLTAQLAARGIVAEARSMDVGRPLGGRRVELWVPPHQVEEARSVAAGLSGADGRGLLDMRRLLPALLVFIVMVLIIVAVVNLVI